MPRLDVIKVRWINDSELHIDIPNEQRTWWARPVSGLRGGDVWELNGDDEDEPEGYYESPDAIFDMLAEKYDLPIVIKKERE